MKKLFILLLSFAVVCGCGKVELSENKGNGDPNIPDNPKDEPNLNPEEDIFLQFCIENFDLDGDGTVSQYEADKVASINCADMEIVRLTDIDKFSNLSTLDCSGNKLVALDLSKNRHLTSANCKRNSSLRSLSVGGCNELRMLDCSNNALTTLNVGGCSALRTLDCSYNKLKTLVLSKTAGIVTVNCKRNSPISLILTDCTELVSLDCSYNSLSSLDVSDSLQLSTLDCSDNDSLKEVWLLAESQVIATLKKDGNTGLNYYRAIGKPATINGNEGIIFELSDNGRHGKIVSLDETECKWATKQPDVTPNKEDGMVNLKVIRAIFGWHEKYPAFAWCADKGEGWYLPAINELRIICQLGLLDGTEKRYYWSSTYQGHNYVNIMTSVQQYYYADSSSVYDSTKYVRAVYAF